MQGYGSIKGLEQEYEKSGAIYSQVQWHRFDCNDIKRYGKSPTFLEIAQRYYNLKFDFNNARAEIEKKYPFINEAFILLGYQEICRLRSKKAVEEALDTTIDWSAQKIDKWAGYGDLVMPDKTPPSVYIKGASKVLSGSGVVTR